MESSVGSAIFTSGVAENMGVAVGIASPSLLVQKLFPFPVCIAAILSFGYWLMSGSVGTAISKSGMVENVGEAVGIASLSVSV